MVSLSCECEIDKG